MIGFRWLVTPEDAFVGELYTTYTEWLRNLVYLVCQRRAPEIENWMKANAIWEDQTGNARQTLNTQVFSTLHEVVVELAHGVDYGIFLELSNTGYFGILAPAIDYWTPILLRDVQEYLV